MAARIALEAHVRHVEQELEDARRGILRCETRPPTLLCATPGGRRGRRNSGIRRPLLQRGEGQCMNSGKMVARLSHEQTSHHCLINSIVGSQWPRGKLMYWLESSVWETMLSSF